jgi:hypothetical protein
VLRDGMRALSEALMETSVLTPLITLTNTKVPTVPTD